MGEEPKNCLVCGQSVDDHFTEFVDGIPHVGSYDAQGNAQRCSGATVRGVGLIDLADLMRDYYKALTQRNVPDALAQTAAGDWHRIALEAGRREIIERMTRRVAQSRER